MLSPIRTGLVSATWEIYGNRMSMCLTLAGIQKFLSLYGYIHSQIIRTD